MTLFYRFRQINRPLKTVKYDVAFIFYVLTVLKLITCDMDFKAKLFVILMLFTCFSRFFSLYSTPHMHRRKQTRHHNKVINKNMNKRAIQVNIRQWEWFQTDLKEPIS